jgi:hypothetical protein
VEFIVKFFGFFGVDQKIVVVKDLDDVIVLIAHVEPEF